MEVSYCKCVEIDLYYLFGMFEIKVVLLKQIDVIEDDVQCVEVEKVLKVYNVLMVLLFQVVGSQQVLKVVFEGVEIKEDVYVELEKCVKELQKFDLVLSYVDVYVKVVDVNFDLYVKVVVG